MLSYFSKPALLLTLSTVLSAGAIPARAQFDLGGEYAALGYDTEARHNPVARLQERLRSGAVQLEYHPARGYFDSFIAALGIDPSSQVLVFSPTSLQYRLISHATPRALYFSDNTYVAWVQGSSIVEVTTLDERLGTVFYIFNNVMDAPRPLERENERCLVCHDSSGLAAGGVPLLLARSGLYDYKGFNLQDFSGSDNTSDRTPIAERWGGWYVTGQHGSQLHLGNMILRDATQLTQVEQLRRGNLDTLEDADFFDTSRYLRATSDIVALMVLEHQITVQNQLTYVKFKAPMVLERTGHGAARDAASWGALPPKAQKALARMLDRLVAALLFVDAAPLDDRISGNPDFTAWFQNQGPRDDDGRSLRDFDLSARLFKYPLSYLVHSPDFDTLPPYAKDYVYQQLAARLRSGDAISASSTERRAALAILAAIEDDFAPYATAEPVPGS